MATLNFRRAVAGAYLSAPDYNWNFDQIETYMGDVTEDIIEQVEEVVSGAVIAVGTIIFFDKNTPPTGYLICDGSTITEEDYPELYALIGNKLPNLTQNRLLRGGTSVGNSSYSATTSDRNQSHGHSYQDGSGAGGYTGLETQGHTHTVTINSFTILPCIKY